MVILVFWSEIKRLGMLISVSVVRIRMMISILISVKLWLFDW